MKLAVIGYGGRIAGVIGNLCKKDPGLRINAFLDPDPAARTRLPEESRADAIQVASVAELLATKPDAVAIGTRCNLHAPYACALAASGLPLYLEKPVAIDREQADTLARAFIGSRCPVVVSFPLRVTPLLARAKELIDSPAFGPVEHVSAVNYVPYGDVYFNRWYRDHRITQGLFLQKATHDLDYLMHLVGQPIVRVAAMWNRGRVYRDISLRPSPGADDALYYEGVGTPETGMNEDSSSMLCEFANGVHGTYTQVFYSRRKAARRGATLSAMRGTLDFDWYRGAIDLHWHQRPFDDVITAGSEVAHWGGDDALADNFLAVVAGKAASCAPLSTGLASVYACLAAKESAERGQFVAVPAVPEGIA